jgi:hypothetical protein
MARGERLAPPDKAGIQMALYLTPLELAFLDELRELHGVRRNTMLRQLIRDGWEREPELAAPQRRRTPRAG